MRVLLDSHTFLWFVSRKPQLSRTADALISDPSNEILVRLCDEQLMKSLPTLDTL